MNEIVRTEPSTPRAPLMAGGRPAAIVPQTMDDAYRLGKAVCMAGMAPRGMDTPEKCMIAIMRGLEVGLTPMQALDKIAVVNGRPTIWGDGALGLVRGSGLCEWVRETISGEGDAMVATCEAKRRGDPEAIKRTFSVVDAKRAKLWNKQGPWQEFPTRMLAMRARAFCLRDGFADVLGGLYLKEELDNGDDAAAPRRAPSPNTVPMIEARPEPAPAIDDSIPEEEPVTPGQKASEPTSRRRAPSPATPPPTAPAASPAPLASMVDPETVRTKLLAAFKKVRDENEMNDAWAQIVDPHWDDLLPPDQDDLTRLYTMRKAELDG